MALVPEKDYALAMAAAEKEINNSPLMHSLASMDLEMKAILNDNIIPCGRSLAPKIQGIQTG